MTVYNGYANLYADGYDLSGDVGSISGIKGGSTPLDVSVIGSTGHGRVAGRRDGSIDYNVWFDPAVSHAYLRNIPTNDVEMMVAIPPSAGGRVAMLVARQVNYDYQGSADLGAAFSVSAPAAIGVPVEWGKLVAKRTDTGATASGTGIDLGVPHGVASKVLTTSTAADPTEVTTSTAHGLQTGDSVVIAGSDKSALNTGWTVTVTSSTKFTVPLDLTGGGATGGTVQRTSHRGWAAMLQVFSITGTSVTAKLQHAPKNLSGSFVDVTSGGFTAATARASQRIASASGILQRYVRLATTGTFNPASLAVGVHFKEG